jgi:hypothetical protein
MHTFIRVTNTDEDKTPFSVGYWAPAKAFTYDEDPEPTGSYGGEWMPLRDCKTAAEAASWVSYLNGGKRPDQPW